MMNNIPTIPICLATAGLALYAIAKYTNAFDTSPTDTSAIDKAAREALQSDYEEKSRNLNTQLIAQKATISQLESKIETLRLQLASEKTAYVDLQLQHENERKQLLLKVQTEKTRNNDLQNDFFTLLEKQRTFMKEIDKLRSEKGHDEDAA